MLGGFPTGTSQWSGFVTGGNRGTIRIRVRRSGDAIVGFAVFSDHSFGPCAVKLRGVQGEDGGIKFRLTDFDAVALQTPVYGEWAAGFSPSDSILAGKWWLEGGSPGVCLVEKEPSDFAIVWKLRTDWVRTWNRFRRGGPALYVTALVIVAAASVLKKLELSSYSLILLLLPLPYLCREQIRSLIRLLRQEKVQKVGLFQFEEQKPIERLPNQLATPREDINFERLDAALAIRTKLLLFLLARSKGEQISDGNFKELALAIGIPVENYEATRQALMTSGCIELSDGIVRASEIGKLYAARLSFP